MVQPSTKQGNSKPPGHVCDSCGYLGAVETIGFCNHFCGDCWDKMSPFERALLHVIAETGQRIVEVVEQELPSLGGLLAATMEGDR